jgi:TRAP-type C4-dicarboxylate transport system permease small subunit
VSTKIFDVVGKLTDYLLIALMVMLLSVVTLGMVTRYVFPGLFVWTDELTRFTLVWVTFIGAAAALRRRMHLGVDIVVNLFKPRLRAFLRLLSQLMFIFFILFMLVSSVGLIRLTYNQLSPALRISIALAYSVMPIGVLCMGIFVLHQMTHRRRDEG